VPWSDELVGQYTGLLELSDVDIKRGFVTPDARWLRFTAQIAPAGLRAQSRLSADIEARVRARFPDATVEVTGLGPLLGAWISNVYEGQQHGVWLMIACTVLLMSIGLRSLRVGLLSLLPNVLPILLFFASLALPGEHFDSDYLIIVIVGLGLVVDDTIHFLARYRLALREEDGDVARALDVTFDAAGAAMIQTSLILTIGLAPLWFSDYASARMFFTQLGKVIAAALVADLLLLPALIQLGWIRYPTPLAPTVDAHSTVHKSPE